MALTRSVGGRKHPPAKTSPKISKEKNIRWHGQTNYLVEPCLSSLVHNIRSARRIERGKGEIAANGAIPFADAPWHADSIRFTSDNVHAVHWRIFSESRNNTTFIERPNERAPCAHLTQQHMLITTKWLNYQSVKKLLLLLRKKTFLAPRTRQQCEDLREVMTTTKENISHCTPYCSDATGWPRPSIIRQTTPQLPNNCRSTRILIQSAARFVAVHTCVHTTHAHGQIMGPNKVALAAGLSRIRKTSFRRHDNTFCVNSCSKRG